MKVSNSDDRVRGLLSVGVGGGYRVMLTRRAGEVIRLWGVMDDAQIFDYGTDLFDSWFVDAPEGDTLWNVTYRVVGARRFVDVEPVDLTVPAEIVAQVDAWPTG